tara:strand:- start:46216 stop:46851 length:636 start_codon:yes stop_codon:yes gene_type:complete
MNTFNESFYTTDFDQDMMDFIESKYKVSDIQWVLDSAELVYGESNNYFLTNDTGRGDSSCTQYRSYYKGLTKQQFKGKIGMPMDKPATEKKTFTKKDLVDGMFVKFRDEDQYRLVLSGNLHGKDGFCPLDEFTEAMRFGHGEGDSSDIVEVLVSDSTCDLGSNHEGFGLESIWKRTPPKSEKVIKLEKLILMQEEQLEATKKLLADELDNV